jgi:hypothetical protein
MAQALLHDLGLLAPPTKPKPTAAPTASSASSSSNSSDNNDQPADAQGEAVLECCLRFWARAQRCVCDFCLWMLIHKMDRRLILNTHDKPREAAAPPDGPGGNKRRKRQRWWASIVAEIGGAFLF